MIEKKAKTSVDIHGLLASRWSPRAIDPQRAVARRNLLALLEAARWAPSCFGDEPWRYIAWDRHETPESFDKAFDCLAEGNQGWVKNAPVLLLACADSTFRRNGKPNRWGMYDTGAASENLCLQATALGLVAHQMGGFDKAKLAETFNIPEKFTPMAMIAIGHPGKLEDLPEHKRDAEQAERKRRPLGECFFLGNWGEPVD